MDGVWDAWPSWVKGGAFPMPLAYPPPGQLSARRDYLQSLLPTPLKDRLPV